MDERDVFVVKYDATSGGQCALDVHRDGALVTFNILLSDPAEFEGGGTFVEPLNKVVHLAQGFALLHCGHLRHGGQAITFGKRYLLVGFLDVRDVRIRPFHSVLAEHNASPKAEPFTDAYVLRNLFDGPVPPQWTSRSTWGERRKARASLVSKYTARADAVLARGTGAQGSSERDTHLGDRMAPDRAAALDATDAGAAAGCAAAVPPGDRTTEADRKGAAPHGTPAPCPAGK